MPERCYNLGCRKALSTSGTPSPTPLGRVLQPRMSEGVEHTGKSSWPRPSAPVLQPRMSEGVEHTPWIRTVPIGCRKCYNLGCRKALSTRMGVDGSFRSLWRCYNLGCRKALSTHAATEPAAPPAVCYNLGCRKALSTLRGLSRAPIPASATTSDVGRR